MKVGFIGLGRMGGHMCSNVIKAGFETYVSDLVPALVEQKVAEGAIGCKDNLEVAANMDIGFTMLPNGAIVEAARETVQRGAGGRAEQVDQLGLGVTPHVAHRRDAECQ